MKRVDAFELMGNPCRIDTKAACPSCGKPALVFADGSVMCTHEDGLLFAPEPSDSQLYELRKRFDERHGITAVARAKVPQALRDGVALPLSAFKDKAPARTETSPASGSSAPRGELGAGPTGFGGC
jgi:hypothetical protein